MDARQPCTYEADNDGLVVSFQLGDDIPSTIVAQILWGACCFFTACLLAAVTYRNCDKCKEGWNERRVSPRLQIFAPWQTFKEVGEHALGW